MKFSLLLLVFLLSGCLGQGEIGTGDNALTMLEVDIATGFPGAGSTNAEGCTIIKRGTAPIQVDGTLKMEVGKCLLEIHKGEVVE